MKGSGKTSVGGDLCCPGKLGLLAGGSRAGKAQACLLHNEDIRVAVALVVCVYVCIGWRVEGVGGE